MTGKIYNHNKPYKDNGYSKNQIQGIHPAGQGGYALLSGHPQPGDPTNLHRLQIVPLRMGRHGFQDCYTARLRCRQERLSVIVTRGTGGRRLTAVRHHRAT